MVVLAQPRARLLAARADARQARSDTRTVVEAPEDDAEPARQSDADFSAGVSAQAHDDQPH